MNAYRFDDSGRAIHIEKFDLPAPWINYLSNGRLHAFVSQAGGGFAWWKDPVNYRISRYRMHHLPIDSPGFYTYIRRKDGSAWSPSVRPCGVAPDQWRAVHQPGKTIFTGVKDGLQATLTLFVAPDYDALVWKLDLKNLGRETARLDVFAYVELSQLVWRQEMFAGYYWRHMLKTWHDQAADAVLYLHHFQYHPDKESVPLVYFASDTPLSSWSGSRDAFMGPYRDESNPAAVERGSCGNESLSTGEPCAALHHDVCIGAGEEKRFTFFLGVAPGALLEFGAAKEKLAADLEQLRDPLVLEQQERKLEDWWRNHLNVLDCDLPDKDAERQIKLWSPVNSVHTARYSRSVNTHAPGVRGFGFRDSCQDMLAIAYRKPEWAAEMLEFLLSHQYADGRTVHSIPFINDRLPDDSLHSDNHLWLPLLLYAILAETGDAGLLDREVPFLAEDSISPAAARTVWEHMLAAVSFTEAHLGAHRLPLTLKGDWNDIIGKFSQRGLGESVFAGQQYVMSLRLLVEIAQSAGRKQEVQWLLDCLHRQEEAILACAWDGDWWLRGFDDDGIPVGSRESEFGRLFLNPQSWAVLSGVGDKERQRQGMNAVREHLAVGVGVKKLMPGFATWPKVSDPFTGYGPGCGENGAVFCHSNTWVIMAEALLGNGTGAWDYFTQLVPHAALQKIGLERYQAEPYAWVSNIVGPENDRFGWANVSQISGTAAWMDVVATQYLLGVRPVLAGLRIDPCIPNAWKSFTVKRLFRNCTASILVENPHGAESGVESITVDGVGVPADSLPVVPASMLAGKSAASILVKLGAAGVPTD
ncbi:MAG: hypothetical protein K0R57_3707 [Paenibacillaceae bacterium]|jgi:cellobiose phosphorylase|nr:hypothetical protein [Paenibacillaceae bacterium]